MNILGVFNSMDSGAALLIDGRIAAAVNEERFNREKLTRAFPEHSIRYVLAHADLCPDDIDLIGCGAWDSVGQELTLVRLYQDIHDALEYQEPETLEQMRRRIQVSRENDARSKSELLDGLALMGFDTDKVLCCDHHEAHAITAFYCSPFDEAVVLTADGRGDFRSVTVWEARRDTGLRLLDFATELCSPGAFYGFVTKHLGFEPNRHEGKVTGMAAMGRHTAAYDILKKGFFFDTSAGRIGARIGGWYRPFVSSDPPRLARDLEPFSAVDIAWAAQKIIEEVLSAFLRKHIGGRPPRSVNLCLAGGCMANVKLNFELSQLPPVSGLYVFPQMGDGGSALGGALYAAIHKEARTHFSMPTVFLGPEYTDDEILYELKRGHVIFTQIDPRDKARLAAEQLAAGRIVGWFQGRMEYGPRALGARSILAPAIDPGITHTLNQRLRRGEFMPFAPVTTDTLAAGCFLDWQPEHEAAKFMTTCYRCTDRFRALCPAAVHVDGTVRPQVIFREDNPDFYEAVSIYHEMTGVPAIINTSFNHHEEPIVMTPAHALESFCRDNVDVLLIGNFLVTRAGAPGNAV